MSIACVTAYLANSGNKKLVVLAKDNKANQTGELPALLKKGAD